MDFETAIEDTRTEAIDGFGFVFPDDDPFVGGGHTHEGEDETHDGIRVLNPGSTTGVGPADRTATMMITKVINGDISVTIHEV